MMQEKNVERMRELAKHYQKITQSVASQLALETPNHHVTSGTSRENVWLNVFRQLIPKKYAIAQGVFIIDSFGHISAEVDIAIYDEQYTPYIFNYGNILFIPIEAVAIVVQSKSEKLDKTKLIEWVKTIQQLKTKMNSYARTLDTKVNPSKAQTATRPIIILCTTHDLRETKQYLNEYFDITLYLDKEKKLKKRMKSSITTLDGWYKELNHYGHERYGADYLKLEKLAQKDIPTRKYVDNAFNCNVLFSLKFELNQLLMLMNNPMFFPHASYAEMFNMNIKFQRKVEEIEMKMENEYLLAVYDITGIQEYIFASNRLKENMGASFIIGNMVKEHFNNILKECAGKDGVLTDWKTNNNEALEFSLFKKGCKAEAEIVYTGGGNALVVYRDWTLYNKVNQRFALKVLEESASLTMVTEAIPFSVENTTSYADLYEKLMAKLSKTKSKIVRTKLNQTLPVFAQEPFKGEPITKKIKQDEFLSTEQWLKREASKVEFFGDISDKFATKTSDLKRQAGEDSYTAIVHIDGNGMGEWLKESLEKKTVQDGMQQHRASSLKITNYFHTIFKETVKEMRVEDTIPLRPLILDGDDITFICRADWGIEFTKNFFEKLKKNGEETGIYACAGVALVHSHFPFQLAYEIAEQCCQRAKKRYYDSNSKKGSYLDFYIVRGSYVQTMDEQLAARKDLVDEAYDMDKLTKLLKIIKDLTAKWPRSRLMKLYEAFLLSEEAVELALLEAESRGYLLPKEYLESKEDSKKIIFDALQLIEFVRKEGATNEEV